MRDFLACGNVWMSRNTRLNLSTPMTPEKIRMALVEKGVE